MNMGDKFKFHLKLQRKSMKEFAKLTGIPLSSVHNVAYNKTNNTELIGLVAENIGVSLAYLMDEKSPINLAAKPFDGDLYSNSVAIVTEVCHEHKVTLTKELLDDFAYLLYAYLLENENVGKVTAIAYANGMIKTSIRLGAVVI